MGAGHCWVPVANAGVAECLERAGPGDESNGRRTPLTNRFSDGSLDLARRSSREAWGAKYISLIRKSVSKDDFFVSQLATTRVGIFESLAHRKHHSNDVVLR